MQVTKTILCDLTGSAPAVVEVALGDKLTRVVRCRLRENGAEWTPPEGSAATVAYVLPDGTPGRYGMLSDGTPAAEIAGSTVSVVLNDRITAQAGAVDVSVVLTLGAAQLATFPFRVRVHGIRTLLDPTTYPALGAEFEGLLLYGGPGGIVTPLKLGSGLSIRDGVITSEASFTGTVPALTLATAEGRDTGVVLEPEGTAEEPVLGLYGLGGGEPVRIINAAPAQADSDVPTLGQVLELFEDGSVYVLGDGESPEDAPEAAQLVIDPDGEPDEEVYTKSEIDAMLGSYITDVAALIGGDA